MRLVRAGKREPDKRVSGAGVVLFSLSLRVEEFPTKGTLCPCYM